MINKDRKMLDIVVQKVPLQTGVVSLIWWVNIFQPNNTMNLSEAISDQIWTNTLLVVDIENFWKLIATAFIFKINFGWKSVDIGSAVLFKSSLQKF